MKRTIHVLLGLLMLTACFTACKKDHIHDPPVVDAGPNQTITLYVDSAILHGSARSDSSALQFTWAQLSGPSTATIVSTQDSVTLVKGLVQGVYTFKLFVTDPTGASGSDTTTVTVNAPDTRTLTLQPDSNENELIVSQYNGTSLVGITDQSVEASTWTKNGLTWYVRTFIKFDLDSIPAAASIKSAHLYLYSNLSPNSGNLLTPNAGTDNSFTVQQIATSWSSSSLTWDNQPAGISATQISIPSTAEPSLDLDLDVKALVQDMVLNNTNYGFVVKLNNEQLYTSRIFVGSRNPIKTSHPKLVIVYQ